MIRQSFNLSILLVCLALIGQGYSDGIVYKMCVPRIYYNDCLTLLKDPSEAGIQMECVEGRDRIDCLDLINQKKADVLAVDPEDMYVAYHSKNQDYRVISEFRTQVEKDAEFRYEGVILIKKSTKANSLKDLRGLKSCHTGFGRNVGYKIPITKLKNHNLLKVSLDPTISAAERELKALSEYFSESCLVGTYSPDPELNANLKKKYANLCALCEKPSQCNYPDIYSGYDGAIRCLDKGRGDLAFTKTSFIKKYFGLIPNGPAAENSNPSDFEYLCEDGTRRPITGQACSWAQRPWKGYISNTDTVRDKTQLKNLQNRLDKFFQNGLLAKNEKAASHLLIEKDLVLHEKTNDVKPKEYLERAGYKDVIERDGSITSKIKFCVTNEIEAKKCNALERAAFSRDIRPDFECVLEQDCIKAVKDKKADVVVLDGKLSNKARQNGLKPIMYESFANDDVYVAVIDPSLTTESIRKVPIKVDKNDHRAVSSARLLNQKRGQKPCDDLPEISTDKISIVHADNIKNYSNKKLLCLDLSVKTLTDWSTCNVEAVFGNAVYVRDDLNKLEKDSFVHSFTLLSTKFGHNEKSLQDVFAIFGAWDKQHHNVIFHDHASELVHEQKLLNGVNEETYNQITCGN